MFSVECSSRVRRPTQLQTLESTRELLVLWFSLHSTAGCSTGVWPHLRCVREHRARTRWHWPLIWRSTARLKKCIILALLSHPNHAIAKAQMKGGFGAVLSILVKGGRSEALDLCRKLRIVKHATSLGGVETLIEHRRSAEGTMALSPDNLLRISVGIEYGDDLIKDFEYALG